MTRLRKVLTGGLVAPWFALLLMPLNGAVANDLPRDPVVLVDTIRVAIETKDYETLQRLVLWKDTGKIKKRIVRFHLNRNLGRPIKSIEFEPFPEGGMDGVFATGKLAPNMEITHQVRVIFDEEPINDAGKLPTSVFLVGLHRDVYRIGLVNRAGVDDDD
ncbi:MAG: hypothetical protein AAF409_13850 [Pseudomonadota bacterium]